MTTPDEIIGRASVQRLRLAGFEIRRRQSIVPTRFTCPMCGYSEVGGAKLDAFADWGEVWHRACVNPRQIAPSRRPPNVQPMTTTRELNAA